MRVTAKRGDGEVEYWVFQHSISPIPNKSAVALNLWGSWLHINRCPNGHQARQVFRIPIGQSKTPM